MKEKIKNEIDFLKNDSNKNLSMGIIFTTIILFIYCYFGSFSFFEQTFPNITNLNFWKIIYHNCTAFVLFFVVGAIFTKFIAKQSLKSNGLRFGNVGLGLKIILIGLPIAILCGLSTTLDVHMVETYPLVNFYEFGQWYQILLYFVSYFLYYIGWEYLFRGLLINSCREKCGVVGAILISTLISALIHTSIGGFGKPMIETLSAIPAGLIFGYIAHKTNSIFPSLALHAVVGFATDIFVFLLI